MKLRIQSSPCVGLRSYRGYSDVIDSVMFSTDHQMKFGTHTGGVGRARSAISDCLVVDRKGGNTILIPYQMRPIIRQSFNNLTIN